MGSWYQWKKVLISARGSIASGLKDLVMSDIECEVRRATTDSPEQPSHEMLADIAEAAFDNSLYVQIMGIVYLRIQSKRWRCLVKGMSVLYFLMVYGPERVVDDALGCAGHFEALCSFTRIEISSGLDRGSHVREMARDMCRLLEDDDLRRMALDHAKENPHRATLESFMADCNNKVVYCTQLVVHHATPPGSVSVDELLGMSGDESAMEGYQAKGCEDSLELDWSSKVFAEAGIDISPTSILMGDVDQSQMLALMPPPGTIAGGDVSPALDEEACESCTASENECSERLETAGQSGLGMPLVLPLVSPLVSNLQKAMMESNDVGAGAENSVESLAVRGSRSGAEQLRGLPATGTASGMKASSGSDGVPLRVNATRIL